MNAINHVLHQSKGYNWSYKVFMWQKHCWLRIAGILMRPLASVQVVCTCWHCACECERRFSTNQTGCCGCLAQWQRDNTTTTQGEIGAPHEQSALPRESALSKNPASVFSPDLVVRSNLLRLYFPCFWEKGANDDCSIVGWQDVYTFSLRAWACFSTCSCLSASHRVVTKLDNSETEVTVMQPIHVPRLKIRMILCYCLCCSPSVCIQHYRADPPGDKRDTAS